MKTLSEASFLTDRVGDKRVFHVVRTAYWKEDKHKLFDEIKARNGEGVVFKMVGAPYQAGRSKFSKKYKFTATATCIVLNNGYSKRSVLLGVKSPDVKEVNRPIGNCTIPANFSIPNEGELVEVRYLYAYPNGGSLFQPVYLGPRTDKDEPDSYDSLKFKAGADPELDAIEEEVTA